MLTYKVVKNQTDKTYIFLRIMLYQPYMIYLKQLQKKFDTNTQMFFYLINKYCQRFEVLANQKSSSKKKYQKPTKAYRNVGMRVSPAVHEFLKDISDATGYSISALVRFLIEWECLEAGFFESQNQGRIAPNEEGFSNFSPLVIDITRVEYRHSYFINAEKVEEYFIIGFQ